MYDSDDDHEDIYPTVNPQPPPAPPDQQSIPSIIQSVESAAKPGTIQSFEHPARDTSSMSDHGSLNNRSLQDTCTPTVHYEAPDPVLATPADRDVLPQEDEITKDKEPEDLFEASLKDVLAANVFHRVTFTSLLAQTVDDLVYYRFGLSLNEHPYSGVPSTITPVAFRSFQEVVRAVGGQHMQFLGTNKQVITDLVSWFPRQNTWNVSRLNVGQWTHECEDWYVKRINTIQEGGAPLSQHEWCTLMRLTRKGPKLVYHMNLAAASYIQEKM